MKKKIMKMCLLFCVALQLTACGKKVERQEEVESVAVDMVGTVESEEETQSEIEETEDAKDVNNVVNDVIETEATLETEAAAAEGAVEDWMYNELLGLWAADENLSFYIDSYEADGKKTYYYTRSDEQDSYYTFQILANEPEQTEQSRYSYLSYQIEATGMDGGQKEMALGITLNIDESILYLHVKDEAGERNLRKILLDECELALNYFQFVAVDFTDKDNPKLSYVKLNEMDKCTFSSGLWKFFEKDGAMHSFRGGYGNCVQYLGRQEDGTSDPDYEITWPVTQDAANTGYWQVNAPDYPYFNKGELAEADSEKEGNAAGGAVESKKDMFDGCLLTTYEGRSYLYHAAENQQITHYSGKDLKTIDFILNGYSMRFQELTEEEYDEKISSEDMSWVISEDWGEGYYYEWPEPLSQTIHRYYYVESEGRFFVIEFFDTKEVKTETLHKLIQSLEPSTEGTPLEERAKELCNIGGYPLKEEKVTEHIQIFYWDGALEISWPKSVNGSTDATFVFGTQDFEYDSEVYMLNDTIKMYADEDFAVDGQISTVYALDMNDLSKHIRIRTEQKFRDVDELPGICEQVVKYYLDFGTEE